MKLLFVCDGIPAREIVDPSLSAINIQTYEVLMQMRISGFEIFLQIMHPLNVGVMPLREFEIALIEDIKSKGIHILKPKFPQSILEKRNKLIYRMINLSKIFLLKNKLSLYYPSLNFRKYFEKIVIDNNYDAIMNFASAEGLAALSSISGVPIFAFEGDIHYHPMKTRVENPALFPPDTSRVFSVSRGMIRRFLDQQHIKAWRKAYFSLLSNCSRVAYASKNSEEEANLNNYDATKYIGTTFSDPLNGSNIPCLPRARAGNPVKIIGHIGGLASTATTFGLQYLLQGVVPHLHKELTDTPFEVHIIGKGKPQPRIEQLMKEAPDSVIRRGFVDDLDSELMNADILLSLNNAGPHRVIASRHIVGWAYAQCVVAHSNSKEALPELVSGENCLLSDTPEGVAEAVRRAATDVALNQRLRDNGRRVYEQCFAPDVFSRKLIDMIRTSKNETMEEAR